MSELQSLAILKIHPGKLAEFKRLSAKCSELVRTLDKGTLQYEVYLNAEETEAMVFERYRDSAALLEHFEHMGETMGAILQTCSASGAVCGVPSQALIDQMRGAPVQIYRPFVP